MKLILQKDLKNLGKAGDQVSVKAGFARNFLIPKGYAFVINQDRLRAWNHQKTIISAKKRKAVSERKKIIDRLSSIKLVFEKESQKDKKIFGSVTAHEISQVLEEKHSIHIDKKDIHFSELKTVGDHKINIRLDSDLQTDILLTIKGKIRKKKESAPIKKTDQEEARVSTAAETASLSESSELKDQASVLAAEESASTYITKEKADKDSEETAAAQKTAGFSEQKNKESQRAVSVTSSQKSAEKNQSQDKFKKEELTAEIKTIKTQSKIKTEETDRQVETKKKEQIQTKKESKTEKSSQEKTEQKKSAKKSGGFFKKLFGS